MREMAIITVSLAAIWVMTSIACAVEVADPDVAAVWLFDEDENDQATDLSKNKHVGQIHGNVKWVEDGKFGGALSFEGNTSWIEVPDHPSLQFKEGQDFTVAAYIKTNMSGGDPPMIVAKNYQPAQMLPWYALYYANQSKNLDGHVSFFLRDQANTSFHIASSSLISDDEWHHVAGTRKGGTIKLYVDGVAEAEMGGADCDVGTSEAPLHINGHLDRWLIGVFDEIVLVRRALTDSEIEALAGNGIAEVFLSVSRKGKLTTTWARIREASR